MKNRFIIIEGGDGLGKSTLIRMIGDYYNWDNVMIRHFGKPPEGQSVLQRRAFLSEALLSNRIFRTPNYYYPSIVIWNRSHLGEYVYGSIFNRTHTIGLKYIHSFEKKLFNPKLILLDSDSIDFFINQEDGNSLSSMPEHKIRELQLFREVFNMSSIVDKVTVKVNNGTEFRKREDIFNDIKYLL